MMNVLDLLENYSLEYRPKRVSANKGGEYHSSCPGCGGEDRFHVWPEQKDNQGTYWCRQCEKAGDAIQFLIDFEGCTFPEACQRLGQDPGEKRIEPVRPAQPGKTRSNWTPKTYQSPADLWREKAEKMVAWCHDQLMGNQEQIKYLADRGINQQTIQAARLGWNPKNQWRPRESWGLETIYKNNGQKKKLWLPMGLLIPHMDSHGRVCRIKIRRPAPRDPEKPKYYVIPGSFMGSMILGNPDRKAWLIIEAELDALAIWQAAGDLVTVCSLGSSSTRPDAPTTEAMKKTLCILDALDYDAAGAKEEKFWSENFGEQRERWPVPQGKDPGEAYQAGVDLREWVLAGLPPRWKIGPSRLVRSSKYSREGAEVREEKRPAKKVAAEPPPESGSEKLPDGVVELARLSAKAPVSIIVRWDRLTLDYSQKWKERNPEKFGRISDLIFQDMEVFRFINNLPAGRYKGRNLANV